MARSAAGPQPVRADLLLRLSDPEDRAVPGLHLHLRHRLTVEDRVHLSRMSLSDRGDRAISASARCRRGWCGPRENMGASRATILCAGDPSGGPAGHLRRSSRRAADVDHRRRAHRDDRRLHRARLLHHHLGTRFTFANVYAAIIVIGICGLVLDQALLLLRRRRRALGAGDERGILTGGKMPVGRHRYSDPRAASRGSRAPAAFSRWKATAT